MALPAQMGKRDKHMGFIYSNIRVSINILLLYEIFKIILFLALNLHDIIIAHSLIYMCWVKIRGDKQKFNKF